MPGGSRAVRAGTGARATILVLALAPAACGTPPRPGAGEGAGEARYEGASVPAPPSPEPVFDPLAFRPPGLEELDGDAVERILRLSPLPPVPPDPTNRWADDPAAARLGQYLFFDERLSGNGEVSCATCHDPDRGWSDGRSFGVGLERVDRHTMSLFNVGHNRWFFWDGRADSLWAQSLSPLEDEREHGGTRLRYAHLIASDPELRAAYEAVFGPLPELSDASRFPAEGRPVPDDPDHPHHAAWTSMDPADQDAVTRVFVGIGKAIAAFERRILTSRSRFDEFVEGWRENDPTKMRSLGAAARRGLALFVGEARCHLCHHGPNFTDLEFHNTRVPPHPRGEMYDPGRYDGVPRVQELPFRGTGRWSDAPEGAAETKIDYLARTGHNWGEFKTPTLRNVALTAPYMHQGQLETLHEVVRHYSTLEDALPVHQHGETILTPLGLSESETDDLVAFLHSLTDEAIEPDLKEQPASPSR